MLKPILKVLGSQGAPGGARRARGSPAGGAPLAAVIHPFGAALLGKNTVLVTLLRAWWFFTAEYITSGVRVTLG